MTKGVGWTTKRRQPASPEYTPADVYGPFCPLHHLPPVSRAGARDAWSAVQPSHGTFSLSLSLSLLPHKCFYKSISLKTNWISHWPSRRRWIIPVYDVVWLIQSHVFLLQLSSGEGTRQIQKTTRASKNKDGEINRGGWANTSHLRLDDAGGVVRASTVREREMESMPRRPYPVSLLAHFPRENRRSSFSFPISSCPSLHPPNTHTHVRVQLLVSSLRLFDIDRSSSNNWRARTYPMLPLYAPHLYGRCLASSCAGINFGSQDTLRVYRATVTTERVAGALPTTTIDWPRFYIYISKMFPICCCCCCTGDGSWLISSPRRMWW